MTRRKFLKLHRFQCLGNNALYLGEMLIRRSVELRTVCSSNAVTEQKGRRRFGGGGGWKRWGDGNHVHKNFQRLNQAPDWAGKCTTGLYITSQLSKFCSEQSSPSAQLDQAQLVLGWSSNCSRTWRVPLGSDQLHCNRKIVNLSCQARPKGGCKKGFWHLP